MVNKDNFFRTVYLKVWMHREVVPKPLRQFLHKYLIVGQEVLTSAEFYINVNKREFWYGVFKECITLQDYINLAKNRLKSIQIDDEISRFLEFVKAENSTCVCEIGTAYGGTNFLLSQALPSVSVMIGIDLHIKNRLMLQYLSRPDQSINLINGWSQKPETIDKVKAILNGRKLDLLFIDGDHSYEGVKQDFLTYRHLVADNGIIVFHDIVPDHRSRYGIETLHNSGGVPEFYKRVKQLYSFREFIRDPDQNGFGIGVIRYSGQVAIPENL